MTIKTLILILCLAPLGLKAVTPAPVGLANQGNTCFMNAALQALYSMDGVTEWVLAQDKYYNPKSISETYQGILRGITQGQKINPKAFSEQAYNLIHMRPGTQQDADEFFLAFLDRLTDGDVANEIKVHLPVYPGSYKTLSELSMQFVISTNSQMIHAPTGFAGHITVEPHTGLIMHIEEGDVSIYQCLKRYFDGSFIDGYSHPITGERVVAQKRLSLNETQKYLILTLKRNYPILDENTGMQKINEKTGNGLMGKHLEPITFPLQGLNMQEYFADQRDCKDTYDLIAVVVHKGGAMGGHYTAYINKNNQWYHCNDSQIRAVSDQEVAALCERGYGVDEKNNPDGKTSPLFLIYEQSTSVHERSLIHPKQKFAQVKPAAQRAGARSMSLKQHTPSLPQLRAAQARMMAFKKSATVQRTPAPVAARKPAAKPAGKAAAVSRPLLNSAGRPFLAKPAARAVPKQAKK